MFTVADIKDDVTRVLGGVDDATFYSRLNHAVEILSTEADWEPSLGYVDVCVGCDKFVTLPGEVGTVLAVNIAGIPTQAHDFWFKYHLNGPGQSTPIGYHWFNGLPVPTFRDPPPTALKLGTILETNLDNGVAFRVYGYDVNGVWIKSTEGGLKVDGFLVPTSYGTSLANSTAPAIRRITRVSKPVTNGYIKLVTIGVDDEETLTTIGQYQPTDTEPLFRRIQLSQGCTYARIAFRKGETKLTKASDLIPLHSQYAIVLMAKALKKFDDDKMDDAIAYQEMAVKLLTKKQQSIEVPSGPSIQMADTNLIASKNDRLE